MTEVQEKIAEVRKKRRIIQVAKEFNVSVESVVEFLNENGFRVKNQMSPVTPDMFEKINERFGRSIHDEIETEEDSEFQRRNQERRAKEKERLELIRREIEEITEKKPPTLEEVQKKAREKLEKEKEEERRQKAAAEEAKKKEELQKQELEAKRLAEAEKQKAEEERKLKEQKARRIERLLARSTPEIEEKEEEEELEVEQQEVEEEIEEPEVAPEEKPEEEKEKPKEKPTAKPGVEGKKKPESQAKKREEKPSRKKKKERIAEEKQKAEQKITGKPRKRKKKERKRKVSEEKVEAAIKKTMQAMEEKGKPKRKKQRTAKEEEVEETATNVIRVSEFISVAELARAMDIEPNEVIKKCMELGLLVSINQRLDMDTIIMVADEFGFDVEQEEMYGMDVIEELDEKEEDPAKLEMRPPVVTIMGHVDHGKTSLLDYIRSSNIIAGEVGSITQHIGAYVVSVDSKKVTFLDTPGHEAFTAMRARGAQVTDIVVLVVAADDRVMPQTIEAINHARAANVPIIVAINKIDKANANPDLIKKQLSENGILVEDWGGSYPSVEISAKTGENVDQLLELLVLQADLLELKANPDRLVKGVIIESELDKGRGPVATVLVQKGTLEIGIPVIAGHVYGKVRAMFDERGKLVKYAKPATPVQVLGFDEVPSTGDFLYSLENEKTARDISTKRQQLKREQDFRQTHHISLDEFSKKMREKSLKELNLIVKADVAGSVEALSESLTKLSNDEVTVNVIHKGVGAITETDVLLASASNLIIIGFQVRPNAKAWDVASREKVDIRTYSIIYDAINDVKSALEGMLEPEEKEELNGVAEIREVFRIPKVGNIAGCHVQSGKITRNDNVRLVREGKIVFEGNISSLRRFKDDVKEIQAGYECGIGIDGFNDIKVRDSIEAFQIIQVKKKMNA